MRRILMLLSAAMLVTVMMAFMAGPAFAAKQGPCPVCPVAANDQAQGSFSTGTSHAVPNSNRNAEEGLQTAFFNNINP